MCTEKDFKNMLSMLKHCNETTNLLCIYNMNRKYFIINDSIEERLIKTFFKFSLTDFKKLLSELNRMDLWENDYDFELQVSVY